MKKLLIAVLVASLVFAAIIPLSAESDGVEDYATAANGELLYTVDFSGEDGAFSPALASNAEGGYNFTVTDEGYTLTIEGIPGTGNANGGKARPGFWGGSIIGLPANANTSYTMMYKVNANQVLGDGTQANYDAKNNSVGFGGWIFDSTDWTQSYNNYSNHNTNHADQRAALSKAHAKLNSYAMFSSLGATFDVDNDGFVTMLLEFNVEAGKFTSYILKDECATEMETKSSWIQIEQQAMTIDGNDAFGFTAYFCYPDSIKTTIKDVEIYKGDIFGEMPESPEPFDYSKLASAKTSYLSATHSGALDGTISSGEYTDTFTTTSKSDSYEDLDEITHYIAHDNDYVYVALDFSKISMGASAQKIILNICGLQITDNAIASSVYGAKEALQFQLTANQYASGKRQMTNNIAGDPRPDTEFTTHITMQEKATVLGANGAVPNTTAFDSYLSYNRTDSTAVLEFKISKAAMATLAECNLADIKTIRYNVRYMHSVMANVCGAFNDTEWAAAVQTSPTMRNDSIIGDYKEYYAQCVNLATQPAPATSGTAAPATSATAAPATSATAAPATSATAAPAASATAAPASSATAGTDAITSEPTGVVITTASATPSSQPVTGAPPVIVIGGCSGSLALSGIAMLTSLGAITVLVVKKKED